VKLTSIAILVLDPSYGKVNVMLAPQTTPSFTRRLLIYLIYKVSAILDIKL